MPNAPVTTIPLALYITTRSVHLTSLPLHSLLPIFPLVSLVPHHEVSRVPQFPRAKARASHNFRVRKRVRRVPPLSLACFRSCLLSLLLLLAFSTHDEPRTPIAESARLSVTRLCGCAAAWFAAAAADRDSGFAAEYPAVARWPAGDQAKQRGPPRANS
jgi:hypothetical protein